MLYFYELMWDKIDETKIHYYLSTYLFQKRSFLIDKIYNNKDISNYRDLTFIINVSELYISNKISIMYQICSDLTVKSFENYEIKENRSLRKY